MKSYRLPEPISRHFQDSRGLKVDGVVQVNGPTARSVSFRDEAQEPMKPTRTGRSPPCAVRPHPAQKAISALADEPTNKGLSLPDHIDSVHQLRIPIDALPRDELISAMRTALGSKGVPRHVIHDFEKKFDAAYGLNKEFRLNGLDNLADGITIARVLGVEEGPDEN